MDMHGLCRSGTGGCSPTDQALQEPGFLLISAAVRPSQGGWGAVPSDADALDLSHAIDQRQGVQLRGVQDAWCAPNLCQVPSHPTHSISRERGADRWAWPITRSSRDTVATHEQLVSKSFQGRHGRAFLFTTATNVMLGPKEERVLMTGLHSVSDIFCTACSTRLGWKYLEAFENRCVRAKSVVSTTAAALCLQSSRVSLADTPLTWTCCRPQPKVQGGQVHRREAARRGGRRAVIATPRILLASC